MPVLSRASAGDARERGSPVAHRSRLPISQDAPNAQIETTSPMQTGVSTPRSGVPERTDGDEHDGRDDQKSADPLEPGHGAHCCRHVSGSLLDLSQISWRTCVADPLPDHTPGRLCPAAFVQL